MQSVCTLAARNIIITSQSLILSNISRYSHKQSDSSHSIDRFHIQKKRPATTPIPPSHLQTISHDKIEDMNINIPKRVPVQTSASSLPRTAKPSLVGIFKRSPVALFSRLLHRRVRDPWLEFPRESHPALRVCLEPVTGFCPVPLSITPLAYGVLPIRAVESIMVSILCVPAVPARHLLSDLPLEFYGTVCQGTA
jgi:hypothetical protein